MLLEEVDLSGQPGEPLVHQGPTSFDGRVQYDGRTPDEELAKLVDEEQHEYIKVLGRRGLSYEDVGEDYPKPISLSERGQLFHDVLTGKLELLVYDPAERRTMINPVATKGILGDSDLAIASMPGSNKHLYNEVVWICLTDNVEFCVVFEGEWERIWFRVWRRNVDRAAEKGKALLVLTKDDGSVGFNQSIEICYLRRQGIKFVTMRTLDFVMQRRQMMFLASEKVLQFAQTADSALVRPLLSQTNYYGDSALSVHWSRDMDSYASHTSSEHAKLVKALLEAKASVLRAERALWHLAREARLYDKNPAIEEMVTLLLQHRADVNSGDSTRSTALHWAAMMSPSDRFVKLLLANRADVHLRDANFETTPLEWAEYNNIAVAEQKDQIIKTLAGK